MRLSFRPLLAPLAVAALVALPACSSSKPAQEASSTPAAQTRGDVAVMVAGPGGPGGPGAALRNMPPQQRAERRLAQLDSTLTLSSEQEARLLPILIVEMESAPRMRREDMQSMTQEQMLAMAQQMQQRRERLNGMIEAVLTPAQVTQFRTMQQQERDRMMRQGPGRRVNMQ